MTMLKFILIFITALAIFICISEEKGQERFMVFVILMLYFIYLLLS